jgi:hypothetical protein
LWVDQRVVAVQQAGLEVVVLVAIPEVPRVAQMELGLEEAVAVRVRGEMAVREEMEPLQRTVPMRRLLRQPFMALGAVVLEAHRLAVLLQDTVPMVWRVMFLCNGWRDGDETLR